MSAESDGTPLEPGGFDEFVDGLDYPMFVVTAAGRGRRAGCLVGFTTQASIHPARMLVCLSVQNRTYDVARTAPALAVHVLDHEQRALAELFGSLTGNDVGQVRAVLVGARGVRRAAPRRLPTSLRRAGSGTA